MTSISAAEAIEFAEIHFPDAPEKLVQHLKIELHESPLSCDGWCLQMDEHRLIRINSKAPEVRRRFTLAHELGHLILGFPSVVGETVNDYPTSILEEERLVNAVAAKLLLPFNKITDYIGEVPVTATVIKKLAKKAKVSEVFVARRLANVAKSIGLKAALVLYYLDSELQWQWSPSLEIDSKFAAMILKKCSESSPNPARIPRTQENDVIVGSILKNPALGSTTIFLQLVHEELGMKVLDEESRRVLENFVFSGDEQFRMSLSGVFGAFKSKIKGMTVSEAVDLFISIHLKNDNRWGTAAYSRLNSTKGRDYIQLRIKELLK